MYKKYNEKINQLFGKTNQELRIFQAPARINIIGEHVDYLGGKVLPAAIQFSMYCAIRKNTIEKIRIYSFQYDSLVEIETIQVQSKQSWANYILGVITEFKKKDVHIGGFDMVIDGDIPEGAGLSSSAALEVVVGYAFNEIFDGGQSKEQIAQIAQAAENHFIGLQCGIMDPFAIAVGKKDHCILLDTNTLAYQYIPFTTGSEYSIYLIQSGVKHSLKDSAYNQRREQCQSALRKIQKNNPEIQNLYSVSKQILSDSTDLTLEERKRVSHVIGERNRTDACVISLQNGNISAIGDHLYTCHESLRHLFAVSCPETDYLVDSLRQQGVTGARMIGGGFGGCILVIDRKENCQQRQQHIQQDYWQKFQLECPVYDIHPNNGVEEYRNGGSE